MATSLFDRLETEARRRNIDNRTRAARNWFQSQAKKLGAMDREQLLKDPSLNQVKQVGPGHMHMFFYDPKTKEKLPYYDRFPLVIIVDSAPGGFVGLNLHYLAPGLRAQFLDRLYQTLTDKRFTEDTRFKLSYDMLKSAAKYKHFKPCVKHYLTKQVRSRFARIPAPEWEIATFLPTADWQKASQSQVYKDSKGMI